MDQDNNNQQPIIKEENDTKNETTNNEQETNDNNNNQEQITAEQEKEIYSELKNNDVMKKGDTYYLISSKWWTKWRDYIGYTNKENTETVSRPGPIDNSILVDENGLLIKEMQEHNDYMIISEALWQKLHSWYGGGPILSRKVISDFYNRLSVEVRLLTIKFLRSTDTENIVLHQFSKTSKVREVTKAICEKMGLNENDVRLWDYHNDRKLKILTDPYETMEEARIINNQKILLEEKDKNGKFQKLSDNNSNREPTTPGLCGLQNLGNTCYMNSGIQCLSNISPISDYLIKKKYVPEINTVNPIGTHGELINEFADLISEIWSGECSSIGPKDFKFKLEKFAPQFSGYNQQDSHEFISSLLDGLHEDVNRIKQKKYSEGEDTDNMSDLENSQLSWKTHKERNDSFIIDWFHGLLKSTIKCPKCPKISIKFDPMMYLQLPLPQKRTREIKILVIPSDLSIKPSFYLVSVLKEGTILDVKKKIVELSKNENLEAENIEICDVYNHKFFKIFKNNDSQSSIQDRDIIHAYCLPSESELQKLQTNTEEKMEFAKVIVIHKAMNHENLGKKANSSGMGSPLIMKFPTKIKYEDLRKDMFNRLIRIIKTKEEIPFHVVLAGEYGDEKKVYEDNDEVELGNKSVLAVIWNTENLQDTYDEAEAKNVDEHPSMNPSDSQNETTVNIEKCLELFSVEEQLDPENEWYCNKCKEHQRAFKKIDVWSLPKVLIIQLKRFSYKNVIFREKLETFVDFPVENLDLSKFVHGPYDQKEAPLYDLVGISQHFGVLGGGHYTAVCKNPNTKKWYNFDDKHVTESSEKRLKTSAAYLLFYQRKDTIDPNFVLGGGNNESTQEEGNNENTPNNTNDQSNDKEDK